MLSARLGEARSAISLDLPRSDLKQCRFARPVAAHQGNTLSRGDGEFRPVQQGVAAERKADVSQL